MWMSLRASTSRVVLNTPARAARHLTTTPRLLTAIESKKPLGPNEYATTPAALLELMGRDATKRLGEKASTWEELTSVYKQGTAPMKEAGVNVKDRKYYMQCFRRYGNGESPKDFAREARPPKKFRGLGTKIQHGVRVFTKQGKRLVRTG